MSARLKLVDRFFEILVSGGGAHQIIVRVRSLLDELSDIFVGAMVRGQFPTPSGKSWT